VKRASGKAQGGVSAEPLPLKKFEILSGIKLCVRNLAWRTKRFSDVPH